VLSVLVTIVPLDTVALKYIDLALAAPAKVQGDIFSDHDASFPVSEFFNQVQQEVPQAACPAAAVNVAVLGYDGPVCYFHLGVPLPEFSDVGPMGRTFPAVEQPSFREQERTDAQAGGAGTFFMQFPEIRDRLGVGLAPLAVSP